MTPVSTESLNTPQTHGSQPTHTLPSMLGSMAWSSRQSTCCSTLRPAAGRRARTLCSWDPNATDCNPGKWSVFSKPSFSSSLTKIQTHLIKQHQKKSGFVSILLFLWETSKKKIKIKEYLTLSGAQTSLTLLSIIMCFCWGWSFCLKLVIAAHSVFSVTQ